VVSGSAAAVVVSVGDGTEAGRAGAAAASEAPPAGGVSARPSELTSAALPATVTGGLAVTGLGMLRGVPLREALSAGVAVAVAAVPEGLPLVATVAQLAAARRLSRCGVLVRSPRTLEAPGRVDVVCFDKTGTLTEGRLEVAALVAADADGPAEDLSRDSERGRRLLRVAARACPPPGSRIAHATDQAVLDAAADLDDPDWELLTELPFQGNRGFAAALGREGGRTALAVKGAPEILLDRCATVRSGEADGGEVPLDGSRRDAVTAAVARLAGRGLRVLALAEATDQGLADGAGTNPGRLDDLARDLTLTGFVAIADVMRPEAADVVKRLAESGVRPVMITGDHPGTASAIAESVAIPDPGDVLTGQDLDQLPERERLQRVAGCSVFARVTPEHKLRIVSDLRKARHVVVMVGDAVREGRSLWRSVSDAVSILVGGNAGEVTFMVLGTALGGRSPLNTRQLLLVNMLTDMFPALAVAGSERRDGDAAEPVSSAPLLTGPLGRDIAVRGGATALGATLAWAGGRLTGRAHRASTMALAAVVGTQLAQTLVTGGRSPALITTSLASAAALVLVINTPGVSQFFGCTPLGPAAWAIVCASAAAATAASLAASSRRQG
jgi:cation-transporting ATPase I